MWVDLYHMFGYKYEIYENLTIMCFSDTIYNLLHIHTIKTYFL